MRRLVRNVVCGLGSLWCRIVRLFSSLDLPEEWESEVSECMYGWRTAYRITTQECTLVITLRIRLVPDEGIPTAELDELKRTWEQRIEAKWSERFVLERSCGFCPCSRYTVTVDVEFVDEGEHHVVRVRRGPARTNMTTWDTGDDGELVAHEVGHMLGLPDEYADEHCPERRVAENDSVMRDPAGVPRAHHYRSFVRWLSNRLCCDFAVAEVPDPEEAPS